MNYVSLQCPDGDIELHLKRDGRFLLERRAWDSNQHKHGEVFVMAGTYTISSNILSLESADNKLQYKRNDSFTMTIGSTSIVVSSWEWISSQKPSFADSISLVEKGPADQLFLASIPNKTKSWWKFWK